MPINLRNKRSATRARLTTTPTKKKRLHSDGKVTCCDFGKNREFFYRGEGFFFCSSCAIWDTEDINNNRIKRTGRRQCNANHVSFVYPTDRRINGGRSFQKRATPARFEDDSSVSDEDLSELPHGYKVGGSDSEMEDDGCEIRCLFGKPKEANLHTEIYTLDDAATELELEDGSNAKRARLIIKRAIELLIFF
jgi:hypothetical protein